MLVANSATFLWRHSGTFLLSTDIQTDIHTFISPPLFDFASIIWLLVSGDLIIKSRLERTLKNTYSNIMGFGGLQFLNIWWSDSHQCNLHLIRISTTTAFVSNAAKHSLLDSRWTKQLANLLYPCPFSSRFSSLITNRWLTSGLKDTMSYLYMAMLFCHYTMYFS